MLCRIIIIVDMSVLKPGQDVGGAIGKPTMLDIVRVDKTPQGPMMTTGRGFETKGGPAPMATPGNAFQGKGGVGDYGRNAQNRNTFNGGGVTMEGGGALLSKRDVFPISSLSPYQNKWTIRARVSSNPSIRTWSNSRGEGRVFSVDLVDESVSGQRVIGGRSEIGSLCRCRGRLKHPVSTKLQTSFTQCSN